MIVEVLWRSSTRPAIVQSRGKRQISLGNITTLNAHTFQTAAGDRADGSWAAIGRTGATAQHTAVGVHSAEAVVGQ